MFKQIVLTALFAGTVVSIACASDPRCNVPPYGGSVEKFQAFVRTFGHIVTPTKTLAALCDAKFGGGDRTGLYNLGFTDRQIDSMDTSDLAVQMIGALKNQVDKLK